MKFLIVIAVVLSVAACLAAASPSAGEENAKFVDGLDALQQLEPELHARHKRATCDLLSATGIRHTACAAHCLFRGNRGGYCNSRAICVCRN